jgi:diaminopimelate epimerase
MRFTKMHGLGNDYVYVDVRSEHIENPPDIARKISDRHTGVGSDGLILMHPSTVADVRMEMYNADGSRGRMCGNGIRCVAKYAVEHDIASGPLVRVETDSGIKDCHCISEPRTSVRADSGDKQSRDRKGADGTMGPGLITRVRVDMGVPSLRPGDLPSTINADRIVNFPMRLGGQTYEVTCVSMGNPHAVVFVDKLHLVDLVTVGPLFEHAPEFPERINVHFVRVDSPTRVTMRTWERGSGATRACGTGACAVCVAGVVTGRTQRAITAVLPGGELEIEWSKDEHVYMTGEAVEVFNGTW